MGGIIELLAEDASSGRVRYVPSTFQVNASGHYHKPGGVIPRMIKDRPEISTEEFEKYELLTARAISIPVQIQGIGLSDITDRIKGDLSRMDSSDRAFLVLNPQSKVDGNYVVFSAILAIYQRKR